MANFTETTESLYSRIPEVYRTEDKNQSIPGPLPEVVDARNMFKNPSFENMSGGPFTILTNTATNPLPASGTGWGAVNSATGAYDAGAAGFRATMAEGGTKDSGVSVGNNSVLSGQIMTYSIEVEAVTNCSIKMSVQGTTGGGNTDPLALVAGEKTRLTMVVTHVAAGTPFVYVLRTNILAQEFIARKYVQATYLGDSSMTTTPGVSYFDGSRREGRWTSSDFGTSWSGTPNASGSVLTAANAVPATSSNRVATFKSSTWSASGPASLRLVSAGAPNTTVNTSDNYATITLFPMGLEEGKTYTISATSRQEGAVAGIFNATQCRNIFLIVNGGGGTYRGFGSTPTPPNVGGETKHALMFTVPKVAGSPVTQLDVRLYHGHSYGAEDVWWDDVMLVEGDVALPYFDGNTTREDSRYGNLWSWEGTPHDSASIQQARDADPGALPLKRYVASIADVAQEVVDIYDLIDFTTPDNDGAPGEISGMIDSRVAREEWLPWLSQMVGAQRAMQGLTVAEQRLALQMPSRAAGSAEAIGRAAKAALTGERYVNVYGQTDASSPVGGAGEWDVLIVTRAGETLSYPPQAVIDAGAKPAGFVLYHKTFETTWDDLEVAYPQWTGIDNTLDWTTIQEAGI